MASAKPGAPVIRLAGVDVTYPNGVRALTGLDLTVGSGERVALVGPSGAGKSTLLGLISGRVLADGARVDGVTEVLGVDPRRVHGRSWRRHARRVGAVRQDHDLIGPLRVVHNVNAGRLGSWSTRRALRSLVRPLDGPQVADALALVGLDAALADARVDELSGGQRQRVALARVVRQAPTLLLADEPVAALDPTLSELVVDLIAHPPAGTWSTTMVSLHQPDLARRVATRVVGIRDGRVVVDVPVEAVDDEVLSAVYHR